MTTPPSPDLAAENAELRSRLEETEETLRAIRAGEVDALVMGEEVYTLKGAETSYRLLIESMNEGAATLAPDGTILYCNIRFAEMVATPAEQVIGSCLRQWVVSAQEPIVRSLVATAQQAGARAELSFSNPAGPELPVLLSLRPIQMDSHSIGVVAADLTERRRAEEALRQVNESLEQRMAARTEELQRQREWLRVTLGSIGDALIATDAAGRVSFLNPVAETLTGWSQQEALGQPVQSVFRIVDETTRIPGEDIVGRVLREGAVIELVNNTCLIARGGHEVPIEDSAAPIKDSDGKVAGAVLVFHDVTAKRRAQHALRESEERLRLLGDNLPESAVYQYVHELDGSVRFLHVSAGIGRLNGVSVEEVLRDAGALHRQIPPEYVGRLVEAEARSKRELSDFNLEIPMRRPDGEVRWMRLQSRPRRLPDGRTAWDGVQTDVTERKQVEKERDRVFECSLDLLCVAGFDGYFKRVSPSFGKTLGWSEAEFLSKPLFDLIHPDDREASLQAAQAHERGRSAMHFENRYWCKDGSYKWLSWNAHSVVEEQLIVGVARDVTETKRMEQAHAHQREELQLILDSAPALIFYKDRENHFVRVNRAFADSMGLPKERLEGRSLFDLYPREQAEAFWRDDQEVLASGRPKTGIIESMRTPVGERWVQTGKVPCRDAQGNLTGLIGFALDITERKQAEDALRQSEELLRAVTENSPDAIYVKDLASRWLLANPAVLRIVGKSVQEALGKTDLELYSDPAIGRAIIENDRRIMERGQAEALEEIADTPDGRRTFLSIKAPRRDAQGNITGIIGISRDITDLKQAEAAARESEAQAKVSEAVRIERQRLAEVLNRLPAYVILLSPDYRVPFANRFFEERFGKSEGRRCYEYLFNRTEPCEVCETYKVLKTNSPLRWEWTGPDGRNYDIHDFPFTDVDGSPLIMEVGLDITGRKQAEAELAKHRDRLEELVNERTGELRASEERYRALFEHMTEGFALHEIITDERGEPCDYRFLEVNPAFERLTGLPPGGLVGKRVREVMPVTEQSWIQNYGKVALTGEPMHFEEFSSALNRWYEVFAYQPAASQFAVVFADITTRKQAERDLFNANQRLEALMRAVPVGVSFSDDPTCQRVTGNPAVLGQFEVAAADNLSASSPDTVAPGRQVRFFREGRPITDAELPLQRAVAENKVIPPMELEVHLPSGRRWFAEASGAPVRGAQGEVVGGLAVTVDITARKRAEEVLRKSEALAQSEKEFRLLAEAMPQIVWTTRADGWNTYFNQQWVDYTGLTLEESHGSGWNKPFHPDDQQRAWDAWQHAVTNRANYALECRLRRADGTYRWWLIRGVPVLDEKGTILKWFGTCTDINDFKRAEEALREAGEERLRLVLEATSVGTFEVDLRTGEGRWNTVEFELLGLKPGDAPSVPATFFRYLHPEDAARVQAQWAEATQTGILNMECRIVRADGQVRWLAGLGRFAYAGKPGDSVPESQREPERFLGVNFDITERKQMEQEVRQRVEELRATNDELIRFNEAMVGRELRMIELKQEIDALCAQLGQPPRYGPIPG